jgi:hypothetical protein
MSDAAPAGALRPAVLFESTLPLNADCVETAPMGAWAGAGRLVAAGMYQLEASGERRGQVQGEPRGPAG